MSQVVIRDEGPGDFDVVRRINTEAFQGPDEAALVDRLRTAGVLTVSLVAEVNGEVVGHLAMSPVAIDRGMTLENAYGLAPMAVLAKHQKRGVGSALVREGLHRLERKHASGVVVVGHASYYPRFGFVRASTFGLKWDHACPDEAFMALELRPGALGRTQGLVRYRPEFDAVS